MTTVIVITAKRNGFRRCGVAHSDQPTTWQQGDFTDEQWEELFKEPQLFLAIYEQDTGLGLEQRHALTSSATLPEASNTAQNAQSQTFEASATTLGDGVLLSVASVAGNLDSIWDDALLEDRAREVTKATAAKPPAKPGKAKAGKE